MARITNIPFEDSSSFPLTVNDELIKVKAEVGFDEEIGQYYLDLNGEPYESLVFLNQDYNPTGKEVKKFAAWVKINEKEILSEQTLHEW